MAWDEWEQLKSDALLRRQHHVALHSAAGGAQKDLKTNHSGKTSAVKALREHIQPETDMAGHHSSDCSASIARTFWAWSFGPALGDAQNEWDSQVAGLMGRLAYEQTALEQTKQDFQDVDYAVGGQAVRIIVGHGPERDA
ncbi:hypothetical protein ACGFW5_24230 [Streptomyces sp. NPDC048416]|uniref:hypothetical protein n=1 Tax=Streptomyces sp. NPDC048416 TaxID=3365546 RepID=UPI00371CE638